MISRRTYAIASVIVLMIVWGSTFVITKAAMREIPPLTLAVLRLGGQMLGGVVALTGMWLAASSQPSEK
ncbi:MAG TPA: hypothetical protein VFS51_07645 [Gemmatimonadales bacterium]|nr:hypothetical protein [Gemmatimonadales bacterium]